MYGPTAATLEPMLYCGAVQSEATWSEQKCLTAAAFSISTCILSKQQQSKNKCFVQKTNKKISANCRNLLLLIFFSYINSLAGSHSAAKQPFSSRAVPGVQPTDGPSQLLPSSFCSSCLSAAAACHYDPDSACFLAVWKGGGEKSKYD